MKRILSTALAALMLATVAGGAASARPYGGWHDRGGHGWHDHRGNGGALLGAGLGLFALGAILATRHDDDRYDDRYYAPPPPPPAYGDDGYGDYGR